MKKIAFIIQHLTNGGAERTISNLSLALQNQYDITLIIFDGTQVTYPYGGKMVDLELPPVEGRIGKILNMIKRVLKTGKIRKQEKFDVVVSFMFGANIVNVLSKQRHEKTITSARNYMSSYGVTRKTIFREKFIANRSDLEVALSRMVEVDLAEQFGVAPKKLCTIYNPCDTARIADLANEACAYPFNKGCFYVITAGRMVTQKGQWHLLKACAILKREIPDMKLLILGDGELRKSLEKLAAALDITENVDFLGFVDNPYGYIARSSCFVLPSLFEGLGNVIIEAMACKTPVVSYDCLAGPRELIAPDTDFRKICEKVVTESCGILVPPAGETPDFTTAIESCDRDLATGILLLHDEPLTATHLVANAWTRIQEFTPDKIVDAWKAVFD